MSLKQVVRWAKFPLWALALCLTALLVSGFSGDATILGQSLDNPAAEASRLPRLRALSDGGILMSWVEPTATGHALKFAIWRNEHWERQGEVARGDNWFVNWSDFPSVVAIDRQFWLSHRLVKNASGKTYDYDVVLSISNNAGQTWHTIGSPHHDGIAAEHGFAAIFPVGESAGVVWLDGREHLKKEERAKHPEKSGNFNLRYTQVHRDGSMEAEQVIDSNTCTCCWPSVAVSADGPVVVWRGRTEDEIRDNRVAWLRGNSWSTPMPLGEEGWKIAGCPVNGPAVAARGKQVVTAWFSAEGDRPRIRAAFSKDGGKHFDKPIEIDDVAPLGRIGLIWRNENTAVISWMSVADNTTTESTLMLRTLNTDGSLGSLNRVVGVSPGRDTGVPQLVATNAGMMLAWTGKSPEYGVRTALVMWDKLQSGIFLKPVLATNRRLLFTQEICGRPH